MAASALLKNIEFIELRNEWPNNNYFHDLKECDTLGKNLSPAIKHNNIQGTIVFLGTSTLDHSLFT